jgi:DTW domain-containing protein YfiP
MKITKEDYLKQKKKSEAVSFQRETFCYKCFKLEKNCLCSHIIPFDPGIRFIILMHPMEAKKEKMGTGRITHQFLINSKIIVGVDFSENSEVNELIAQNNAFVMYPGDDSLNVSKETVDELKKLNNEIASTIIFLIDGTWPCAKKMMKASTNLQKIPKISFDVENESIFDIKEQPSKYCLSTLESIHLFLDILNNKKIINIEKKHDEMLSCFKVMIDFQKKCASDPSLNSYRRNSKSYKPKNERVQSKKWEKRSILYKPVKATLK